MGFIVAGRGVSLAVGLMVTFSGVDALGGFAFASSVEAFLKEENVSSISAQNITKKTHVVSAFSDESAAAELNVHRSKIASGIRNLKVFIFSLEVRRIRRNLKFLTLFSI